MGKEIEEEGERGVNEILCEPSERDGGMQKEEKEKEKMETVKICGERLCMREKGWKRER